MNRQNNNTEPEAKKTAGKNKAKAPASRGEQESVEGFEERLIKIAEAIDGAIENIRGKLTADDLKASVSDLVRLIQLRKELIEDAPKQVTVRWIEEWNNSPANEE